MLVLELHYCKSLSTYRFIDPLYFLTSSFSSSTSVTLHLLFYIPCHVLSRTTPLHSMSRIVTYHAATFYVTYCHVSRRYILCHVLSHITPLHSMSRIVTYHTATFYITYCHVSRRYILCHVLSRITPLHSMSRIVTYHTATFYVTYCDVSRRYILCHVLWRITPLHSMSRITPLFVLCCFSLHVSLIVFICDHISTVILHVLSPSLFFPLMNFQFFFIIWWHTSICLCLSGNLLYCTMYFSLVSVVTIYFSLLFYLISHTVVATITLSTTSHSCLLLCTCTVLCFRCFIRWWVPGYIHMPYYYIGRHVIYVFYFLSVVK